MSANTNVQEAEGRRLTPLEGPSPALWHKEDSERRIDSIVSANALHFKYLSAGPVELVLGPPLRHTVR